MNIHEFNGYPWIIRTIIKNSMDIHGSTMHRSDLESNVRFVEIPISRSLCPYMVLREANGLFYRVQAKNSWKKICFSFSDRNKLDFDDGRPWLTNRMGANFFSV
jgi:hypothetical protein